MLFKLFILIFFSSFLGLIYGILFQIEEIIKKEKINLSLIKKVYIVINIVYSRDILKIFKPSHENKLNQMIRKNIMEQLELEEKEVYSNLITKTFEITGNNIAISIIKKEIEYINYFSQKLEAKEEEQNYLMMEKVKFCISEINI